MTVDNEIIQDYCIELSKKQGQIGKTKVPLCQSLDEESQVTLKISVQNHGFLRA